MQQAGGQIPVPGNLSFLVDLSVSAWVCRLWGLWWCTSEYLPLFLPWAKGSLWPQLRAEAGGCV